MTVSVRTRFEVFKRDRFTCRYCGRHAPDVLVEVDHIIPVAAGGSSEMDNLITACWDCNRGKADRLLEEGSRPVVSQEAVDEVRERVAQAEAYAGLIATERRLHDRMVSEINAAWARAFGAKLYEHEDGTYWLFPTDYEQFPEATSLRTFLRRLPLADILEAVDETAARCERSTYGTCRYFYAICWRRIKNPNG
jgi:hypothetical protein